MIEFLGISFGTAAAAGLLTLFLRGLATYHRPGRVEAFAAVRRRTGRKVWMNTGRR
jgi:hypothetical protein